VKRHAAEPVASLGDGDALAELRGLDGRLLSRWARADDQQIEFHADIFHFASRSRRLT
jgi:hypothetical protein